jgi:hypothetical protein
MYKYPGTILHIYIQCVGCEKNLKHWLVWGVPRLEKLKQMQIKTRDLQSASLLLFDKTGPSGISGLLKPVLIYL